MAASMHFTYTSASLADCSKSKHDCWSSQIYPTKDYLSVEHALDSMATEEAFQGNVPGAAAFACAGPVLDNKCVMTNLSWVIDGQSLTVKYGIRYGVPYMFWLILLAPQPCIL